MNRREELQKLIDAIRKGRQDYKGLKQYRGMYAKEDRNGHLCAACAVGFALLVYGYKPGVQSALETMDDHLPILSEQLFTGSSDELQDRIYTWNDEGDSVETIVERLEQLKDTL